MLKKKVSGKAKQREVRTKDRCFVQIFWTRLSASFIGFWDENNPTREHFWWQNEVLRGFRRFYRAVMSADCELEEDVGEAAISDEIEGRIENFKDYKAKQRLKNKLLRVEERLVKCVTNLATPRDVQWKQCISFNGICRHQGQRKTKKSRRRARWTNWNLNFQRRTRKFKST